MSGLPKNIAELAEKNTALLASLGFERGSDDPLALCDPEAYRRTNLFKDHMIDSMFSDCHELPEHARPTIPDDTAMLLIRPDMVHARDDFEGYIQTRFMLIEKQDIIMDVDTYWEIYRHDLYRPETMHSRLTRAALYIGSTCCLMVFKQKHIDTDNWPLADYVCKRLKGCQGIYMPGTLRGDVVYRNALQLGFHRLEDDGIDSRIIDAIDPFGAFQLLSRSSDDPQVRSMVHPLLFYTGVGVHIPDAREIHTDLPALRARL